MLLSDILENRRNSEQNPKMSVIAFLEQYRDNPKAYLHTGPILKVGLYPKSSDSHDSPTGVYAYRLMDIWKGNIEPYKNDKRDVLIGLPYYGGPNLFILESDIDTDFPHHYTEDDLRQDIKKLRQLYNLDDDDVKHLVGAAKTNLNFRKVPAGILWGMTKAIAAGGISEFDELTPTDCMKWNRILRKLGYVGFNDPGMGLLHGAESSQAVFLVNSAYRVIDHMLRDRKQKSVRLGDKEYVGGRLPKHLHMRGIGSTLFYNYTPEDFKSVKTWTVDGMGISEISQFSKFVPWNGLGIVKQVIMGNAANEWYERGEVEKWFQKHPTLPKNIKVESFYVGGRDPYNIIRYIPENFPVATIWVSEWSDLSRLDRLPEALKAKIKVQKAFSRS